MGTCCRPILLRSKIRDKRTTYTKPPQGDDHSMENHIITPGISLLVGMLFVARNNSQVRNIDSDTENIALVCWTCFVRESPGNGLMFVLRGDLSSIGRLFFAAEITVWTIQISSWLHLSNHLSNDELTRQEICKQAQNNIRKKPAIHLHFCYCWHCTGRETGPSDI